MEKQDGHSTSAQVYVRKYIINGPVQVKISPANQIVNYSHKKINTESSIHYHFSSNLKIYKKYISVIIFHTHTQIY